MQLGSLLRGGHRWQRAEVAEPGGMFLPCHQVVQRCFQLPLGHCEDVVSCMAEAFETLPSVALGVHSHGLGARRVIMVNGGSQPAPGIEVK